jgi:zinc transporter ZupT
VPGCAPESSAFLWPHRSRMLLLPSSVASTRSSWVAENSQPVIHYMHEDEYAEHKHPQVGVLSALALIGHSFADGLGIGLGFQVSTEAGVLVALAVIAHDFSDGLNTVSLVLTYNNTAGRARLLLACDALAPVLGAASTLLFTLPEHFLVLYLGVFAGFLMHIGASDILPQAHSKQSSVSTLMLTFIGALFIFIITRFT